MYLLDTHIFFWRTVEPEKLPVTTGKALDEAEAAGESLYLSVITLWELAMLARRDHIETPLPFDLWIQEIEANPAFPILQLNASIIADSVRIGDELHRDPADRFLVATARHHGLILATADRRIRNWAGVPVV